MNMDPSHWPCCTQPSPAVAALPRHEQWAHCQYVAPKVWHPVFFFHGAKDNLWWCFTSTETIQSIRNGAGNVPERNSECIVSVSGPKGVASSLFFFHGAKDNLWWCFTSTKTTWFIRNGVGNESQTETVHCVSMWPQSCGIQSLLFHGAKDNLWWCFTSTKTVWSFRNGAGNEPDRKSECTVSVGGPKGVASSSLHLS